MRFGSIDTSDWRFWTSAAIAVAIAIGVTLAIEEYGWLRRSGKLDSHARAEMRLSFGCLIPNTLTALALLAWWTFVYRTVGAWIPWSIATTLPTGLAALLGIDFCYYLEHRTAHRVPFLWRLYHQAHHSSDRFTIATAYRVSLFNHFVGPLFYLPCVLMGFDPLLILALQVFIIHYQAWVHTEMIGQLGWLDRLFNTPAIHRVHHSRAMEHRHCNFGSMLMVWDRIFGTYVRPQAEVEFGSDIESPRKLVGLHVAAWRRKRHEKGIGSIAQSREE